MMPSISPVRLWLARGVVWCAERWPARLITLAFSPAVLVIASMVLVGILVMRPNRLSDAWYAQQAIRSKSAGDFATARLCYASLLQRSPTNAEYQYGMAISLSKLGENAAAAMLMRRLTPEDAPGHPPAQLDLARQQLGGPSPNPDAVRSTEARLKQVLKAWPKEPKAHSMLAVLYSKSNRWDLAKKHMAQAGGAADELAFQAALAFADRGDQAESEVWARRAAAYLAPRVMADPKNDDLRLQYAQAYLLLHDFPQTLEILEAGWEQDHHPVFRKVVAHVTSLWVQQSPTMEAGRRLALIENGLSWDSQNTALLQMLLEPVTLQAAALVQPTTEPLHGAAIYALIQAVDACRQKNPEAVRSELQRAIDLGGPPMASIAAYLSSVWADSKAPDSPSALTLSTTLLEIRPNEPISQWAQGKVLAQQGKWAVAVGYLEAALAAMPEDRSIHGSLATVYEKLGRMDLAATHRLWSEPTTAPGTMPATNPPLSEQMDHK